MHNLRRYSKMQTLTGDFLKLQVVFFRVLGFDIVAGTNGWQHPWRTWTSLLSLVIVHVMAFFFSIQNLENMDKLTEGLAALLINHLALFKFGLMIFMHKDFQLLIAELREMLTRECETEVPSAIIGLENKREQRVSGIYKNCFLLAGVLSSLKPSVSMLFNYLHTGQLQLDMNKFPCAFPWDNEKLHFALLSYALLVSASFAVVLPTICVDTLYIFLVFNLVALFKTAQHKIQHFEPQTKLGDIIYLYQRSLELSDVLNGYFRLLVCTQLLVGSLHLCVLSYLLSNKLDNQQVPFYVVFTISVLCQLYVYCSCGEYLKAQSRGFARAIYDSPWYERPDIGRSLQLSMMRAQRGSRIDGIFFEANMEVFLSIVRKAMSYFTLLNSIS